MTDPISDMLTRIRNAILIRRKEVVLPYSKFKESLAELLKSNGRLEKVEIQEDEGSKYLKLTISYESGLPKIAGLKRISKPGQRIYSNSRDIPSVRVATDGITVVSTSKGLMTDEQARAAKVGGEIICQIW